MAHFWNLIKTVAGERWEAVALAGDGGVVSVNADGWEIQSPAGAAIAARSAMMILPTHLPGARPRWTLLAGCSSVVRVNGLPLALGVRVLADKDEILAGGQRLFFSVEELARVIPFPVLVQPAFCPRCKRKLETGDPAVCCPSCRAWSHQTEKFPCWTYEETCALCQQQSTALDAGFNFNPAML